ncbi:MAG: hypothetical protein WCJ92_08235 [Alphaproteobacteria bacterium]
MGRWIVLLDADMLLLKNPVENINSIVLKMKKDDNKIALCQDMGSSVTVAQTVEQFLNIFGDRTPIFKENTLTLDISRPYLNSGFVIFSTKFDFYEFKYHADLMEGDMIWEQNAINLMCLEGLNYLLLDAKKWNLHGSKLLNSYSAGDDPFIIHMTGDSDSLDMGLFDITIDSTTIKFYYRYVKNKEIFNLQINFIQKLVNENVILFSKYLM